MADFTNPQWSTFIALAVIISIIACFALAWALASVKAPVKADGTVESTGHVWDEDLQELNNPLPRWWLYLFYITCIYSGVYLLLYPGLGTFKGLLDWTSANQYDAEVAHAKATYDPLFEKYLQQEVTAVAAIPEAVEMGERLYLTYCTQCHGSDARGGRSFPDLTDNDWLGTGDVNYIKNTIVNGRQGLMPPMGGAIGGTDGDVTAVANYVLSLSGSNHDAALVETGQGKFAVCSACHGPAGEGNSAIGSPNLTDDTWLHGGSLASIESAVQNGLTNKMPAFGELLGEGKVHVLSAYILSLSNSPTDKAAE